MSLELVLPNPAGGRGAYVLPWANLSEVASPTLHDMRLAAELAAFRPALPPMDAGSATPWGLLPDDIREVALGVAAEGFAGRAAAAGAREAWHRSERERAAAHAALSAVLPRTASAGKAATVAALATVFVGLGIGAEAAEARVPTMLRAMSALVRDLCATAAIRPGSIPDGIAIVAAAAELTRTLARRAWATARAPAEQPEALLLAWQTDAAEIVSMALRPVLLLDGWERICLLWRTVDTAKSPDVALRDILAALPTLPAEVDDWFDLPPGTAAQIAPRRVPDSGLTQDVPCCELIARNELLRTLMA